MTDRITVEDIRRDYLILAEKSRSATSPASAIWSLAATLCMCTAAIIQRMEPVIRQGKWLCKGCEYTIWYEVDGQRDDRSCFDTCLCRYGGERPLRQIKDEEAQP